MRIRTRKAGHAVVAAAAAVTVVMTFSACGTRLSDAQIAAGAQATVLSLGGANASGNTAAPSATTVAGGDLTTGAGATAGAGDAGGLQAPASTASQALAAPTAQPTARANAANVGTSGGSSTTPCTSQGAPIVIGQDGAFSGIIGQATSNVRTGMSVWSKYINSVGGIACHPVQLFQEDDNSDPSKTGANITDLVHNKHVIALVGTDVPITIAAARSTADQLGMPMVGGDLVETDWNQYPNLYPNGGAAIPVYGGALVQAQRDTGHAKIGLIYCVEAEICSVIHANLGSMAAGAHGTVVFQQSASLTQTSFTAECQNAKSAGADLLFLAMDGSSMQRITSSCNGVNYHPTLATAGIAANVNALQDPNVKADGIYIGTNQAPYVATSSPALQAFHAAFKQFAGTDAPDQSAMIGWTAGQLFAAAVNALGPAARNGPVTTAMVVQGLGLLRNETLGGLLPPMTYLPGKPTPGVSCYSTLKDTSSGIIAPNDAKFTCS